MKRATQAGDLEGANKIQEVLNKLPAAARLAKPVPKTRKELASFLHGTVWDLRGTPESKGYATMTFNKDGTMKYKSASENRTGAIQFLGPESVSGSVCESRSRYARKPRDCGERDSQTDPAASPRSGGAAWSWKWQTTTRPAVRESAFIGIVAEQMQAGWSMVAAASCRRA